MPLFRKRSRSPSLLAYYLNSSGAAPAGYHRILDSPEIAGCINRIAALIASAPIYQLENTEDGDKRIYDALTRVVDIDPCAGRLPRSLLTNWIVTTLLGEGDGNAFVLMHADYNGVSFLQPMPGASMRYLGDRREGRYCVDWNGQTYDQTEVLHYRLFADPEEPFRGRGVKVQAQNLAASLAGTDALKNSLTSPDYKPPMLIFVNSDSPLSDQEKRDKFADAYLEQADSGRPWILPADLAKVETIKPLSLADLAIKDTVELDKRTACGIYGMPPFMMGLGGFNRDEYNLFIRTVCVTICKNIDSENSLKLNPEAKNRYFQTSRRRLYDYDLETLISIDCKMADRGYLNGDEVREDADRDPAGLKDFKVLENYIPYDESGNQKKLRPGTDNDKEEPKDA